MLGRLEMSIDECITAYLKLSSRVFEKKAHRVKINGKLQGRFDSAELEKSIKEIVGMSVGDQDALLKDANARCKVYVYSIVTNNAFQANKYTASSAPQTRISMRLCV